MIQKLLPASVITVVATPDMWIQAAYPDEMSLVKNAVTQRQQEFQAGRNCAKEALSILGIEHFPILSGVKREPIWPEGIVGSITHCKDYCAAALCKTTVAKSIGIDVEKKTTLDKSTINLICTKTELAWLSKHDLMDTFWSKVIFSAKECLYKCYYPLTHQYLDFLEAELSLDLDKNIFTAKLLINAPSSFNINEPIKGSFLIEKDYIFTTLIL